MEKAIIIGDLYGEFNCPEGFDFISQFYLHGDAQDKNHYDICLGNLECFVKILHCHIFLIELQLQDGNTYEGIVIPYIAGRRRLEGLVCLCNDTEGIKHALFEYHDGYIDTCMDDTEEKYIFEKYPEIKQLIHKYNRK